MHLSVISVAIVDALYSLSLIFHFEIVNFFHHSHDIASEKEVSDLKEAIEDLRFQTVKQERMIRGLRYQVSV